MSQESSVKYWDMWEKLGLDLAAHERLLQALPPAYGEIFLTQENRPQRMDYFDFVVNEIHGQRIQELQEHKQQGGKIIGAFCVYVPEEIIRALGGECIGLCSGLEVEESKLAQVLPLNICPLIKSFMGFKLARICPYFESCDLLVGETTCDGKKKAFEILSEYAPVYVLELPHKKGERSRHFWRQEVTVFARSMEEFTGRKLDAASLLKTIKTVNRRRKALMRLAALRRHDPPPISGRDALLIAQIAMYDNVERLTDMVNALCDELEERIAASTGVCPPGTPRIVITGTPMAIPNWKVPYLIERQGAVIVAEELCTGLRFYEHQVNEDVKSVEEMMAALADRYLQINCACFTPNPGREEKLFQLVDEYRADGVVYCSLAFCDSYLIEGKRIERLLKEKGIPVLFIETDYGQGDRGQLETRIEAFIEMLRTGKK